MKKNVWTITQYRFVAFFDILGFKELVDNHPHDEVLQKLYSLKASLSDLADASKNPAFKETQMDDDQTRSVTFSDSIIVFSKADTPYDAIKIVYDAYAIQRWAIDSGLPIKGAIAYGEISVDFEASIFFGKPIIQAYLLHEELQMMTTILHHTAEVKLKDLPADSLRNVIADYKVYLKTGRVTHKVMHPNNRGATQKQIESLKKMYDGVSGRSRVYIDNTVEFLNEMVRKR